MIPETQAETPADALREHDAKVRAVRGPSDAEVFAAAHAIYDHDAESLTCYDHDSTCCPCGAHDMGRAEWQVHRARAVLLAAQEV